MRLPQSEHSRASKKVKLENKERERHKVSKLDQIRLTITVGLTFVFFSSKK